MNSDLTKTVAFGAITEAMTAVAFKVLLIVTERPVATKVFPATNNIFLSVSEAEEYGLSE